MYLLVSLRLNKENIYSQKKYPRTWNRPRNYTALYETLPAMVYTCRTKIITLTTQQQPPPPTLISYFVDLYHVLWGNLVKTIKISHMLKINVFFLVCFLLLLKTTFKIQKMFCCVFLEMLKNIIKMHTENAYRMQNYWVVQWQNFGYLC